MKMPKSASNFIEWKLDKLDKSFKQYCILLWKVAVSDPLSVDLLGSFLEDTKYQLAQKRVFLYIW